MGVERFEAEVSGEVLTLRFTVRPVDGNQQDDERHLHSEELQSVQISDDYVIEQLTDFLAHQLPGISGVRLEILSMGKKLLYSAEFGAAAIGCLPLLVKRIYG